MSLVSNHLALAQRLRQAAQKPGLDPRKKQAALRAAHNMHQLASRPPTGKSPPTSAQKPGQAVPASPSGRQAPPQSPASRASAPVQTPQPAPASLSPPLADGKPLAPGKNTPPSMDQLQSMVLDLKQQTLDPAMPPDQKAKLLALANQWQAQIQLRHPMATAGAASAPAPKAKAVPPAQPSTPIRS